MYTNKKTRCRRQLNSDSGFTVIELLISFTILAVVAGSLFQIFFVSAQKNSFARDYDMANNLAVTAVELFKSNPDLSGEGLFSPESGPAGVYTWRSADKNLFFKFYDEKWRELDLSSYGVRNDSKILSAGAGAGKDVSPSDILENVEPPDFARYMLTAVLGSEAVENTDRDYYAGAARIALGAVNDYRLVVNDHSGVIEVLFNGVSQDVNQNNIGRAIPINVDFSFSGMMPKTVSVVNRTDIEVQVNMFITGQYGNSNFSGGGEGYDRSEFIKVIPVEGALGVAYFDDQIQTAESETKTIAVSVRELGKYGMDLVYIEANKYLPG